MATINRQRSGSPPSIRQPSRSPPAIRRRSRSPPATASSLYFPPELIPEVARRLTSLQDFFALRATFRAYRALLPLTRSNLASQAPLLVIPDDATGSHALFHLPLRRTHRFRLPRKRLTDDFDHIIVYFLGCCSVAIDDNNGSGQLRVVHLLTGEQACVPSPTYEFYCILLSGDLVLTWDGFNGIIEYCRLRTAEWRETSISQPYSLVDLISLDGILYALVTPGYRLAVLELSEF